MLVSKGLGNPLDSNELTKLDLFRYSCIYKHSLKSIKEKYFYRKGAPLEGKFSDALMETKAYVDALEHVSPSVKQLYAKRFTSYGESIKRHVRRPQTLCNDFGSIPYMSLSKIGDVFASFYKLLFEQRDADGARCTPVPTYTDASVPVQSSTAGYVAANFDTIQAIILRAFDIAYARCLEKSRDVPAVGELQLTYPLLKDFLVHMLNAAGHVLHSHLDEVYYPQSVAPLKVDQLFSRENMFQTDATLAEVEYMNLLRRVSDAAHPNDPADQEQPVFNFPSFFSYPQPAKRVPVDKPDANNNPLPIDSVLIPEFPYFPEQQGLYPDDGQPQCTYRTDSFG